MTPADEQGPAAPIGKPPLLRPRGFARPRVVLEFAEGLSVPYADRTAPDLAKFGIGSAQDWAALAADFQGIQTRRVFRETPAAQLGELELRAKSRRPDWVVGSLQRYYSVEVPPGPRGLTELSLRIRELSGVTRVWVEEVGPPPVVLPAKNPRWKPSNVVPGQRYLGSAPNGIDAEYAWSQPGGDGKGMVFIDVEEGWTLDHDDLAANRSVVRGGVNVPESCGHGTSVLGIVCGTDDNAVGGVGIVPNLNSADVASYVEQYRPASPGQAAAILATSVADAIALAASMLSAGQVLLVEAQVYGPDGMLCPVELNPDARKAIACAVAAGIVVVEAGGNGDEGSAGVDLDTYLDADGRRVLAPGDSYFEDSGAILVSAADPATRVRMPWAPFGSRIDCWSWGDGIDTCDSAVTPTGAVKDIYRQDFGGTSGAAAIVAGAVLALQGVARAWTGSMLAPEDVRRALRNPSAGTPASGSAPPVVAVRGVQTPAAANEPIGLQPDLRALLGGVLALPRVFLRDFAYDTGVPHTGAVDGSPDIVVTVAPGAAASGSAAVNSVTSGIDHEIRAHLRNVGGADAANVVVDVFDVDPAQIVKTGSWIWIGRTAAAVVPMGGAAVATAPVPWLAKSFPPPGKRLLVAVVGTATTPPELPYDLVDPSNFDHLVRETGLVAARAIVIV